MTISNGCSYSIRLLSGTSETPISYYGHHGARGLEILFTWLRNLNPLRHLTRS